MALSPGIVGVGNMGVQILEKLKTHYDDLPFVDPRPTSVERALAVGGREVGSLVELVEQVDVVLTVLPRDQHVEEVARNGLLAAPHRRCGLWIEMSTINPRTTRAVSERAARVMMAMVDAAIVGRFGQLSFLVGGTDADSERAREVLGRIGPVIRCGGIGSGVTAKIVNNLLAGTTFVATCEALALGLKAGLDLELLLEVLKSTAANNAHLVGSIPEKVAQRDFAAGFSMELMQKDAQLAVDLAEQLGVPLRLAGDVYALRKQALSQGMGSLDTTALANLVEEEFGKEITWTNR